MRPDRGAQRTGEQLAAEADAEIGAAGVDVGGDPIDLAAEPADRRAVIGALVAAEDDDALIGAAVPRQRLAGRGEAPFDRAALGLQLRLDPLFTHARVVDQQDLAHLRLDATIEVGPASMFGPAG